MKGEVALDLMLFTEAGGEVAVSRLTAGCESYTPAERGRISGRPEDCYPDEPEEMDGFDVVDASGDKIDIEGLFGADTVTAIEEMVLAACRAECAAGRENFAVERHLSRNED
jgi:hypothetical protein